MCAGLIECDPDEVLVHVIFQFAEAPLRSAIAELRIDEVVAEIVEAVAIHDTFYLRTSAVATGNRPSGTSCYDLAGGSLACNALNVICGLSDIMKLEHKRVTQFEPSSVRISGWNVEISEGRIAETRSTAVGFHYHSARTVTQRWTSR